MIKNIRETLGRNIDTVVDRVRSEFASLNGRKAWDQITVPTAVLLDWDYHLIDSLSYYNKVANTVIDRMLGEHGIEKPEKLYCEKGWQKSLEYYWQVYGSNAQLAIEMHQQHLRDVPEAPKFKPGAAELLKSLNAHSIPYAIVSDADQTILENNVRATLREHNIPAPIVVGTSSNIVGKPEPDSVFKALALLSAQSGKRLLPNDHSIIMIGDLPSKDGAVASRAGLSHVIVPSEKTGDTAGWFTLPNLIALTEALENAVQYQSFVMTDPANDLSI